MGSQLAAMIGRFAKSMTMMWRGYPLEGTVVALLVDRRAGLPVPDLAIRLPAVGGRHPGGPGIEDVGCQGQVDGSGGPVVVAVVGTGVALATGGARDTARAYAHEVGTAGPPLLKAAVVLGACYLAWRVRRGPRAPAVPPWNRPHRI